MKEYYLKILSKNEKSLKKFLIFFFKHLKTRFNIIQKFIVARNKKKIITLLKSPHVNKKAQEHFELRIFSKQISVISFYLDKNLMFLKNNLNRLFQDILVILEFRNNLDLNYKNKLLAFYPDSFKLFKNSSVKKNIKRANRKTISKENILTDHSLVKALNILSIFGEMLLLMY